MRFNFANSKKVAIGLMLGVSIQAYAATVALTQAPLNIQNNGNVKPNILFDLDDSGSMSWTFLPDDVSPNPGPGFRGAYGYLSSQCNAVYYNPNLTYTAPVAPTSLASTNPNTLTRLPNASFSAAWDNGFDQLTTSSPVTRNLNNNFQPNRFVSDQANNDYSGWGGVYNYAFSGVPGAVYYLYTGSVTDKNYSSTSSTFYTQCVTAIADKTIAATSSNARTIVTGVNGLGTSAPFTRVRLASSENTKITISSGPGSSTAIKSIKVNGVELMNAASTAASSATAMATNIAAKITLGGFSATASSNVITITGPTSAAGYTPVIGPVTTGDAATTFTTDVFPYTDAAKLTNFANWYSYYRTRMLMMKSSAGEAFASLDDRYRIGLNKTSKYGASDGLLIEDNDFTQVSATQTDPTKTQRYNWYNQLYKIDYSLAGTPLRGSLSHAGRYYAHALTNANDPIQYSCQQNFTLLATDGYWNDNDSDAVQLDGSTIVGNQDGAVDRPQYDGATAFSKNYTRTTYTNNKCSFTKPVTAQPQKASCIVKNMSDSCAPATWTNNGKSSCVALIGDSTPVLASTTTSGTSGADNTLADVAQYYYMTDLRTPTYHQIGALGKAVDENNVYQAGIDNNKQQHMTTFTLGLGVNGLMDYDPGYANNPNAGDYGLVYNGTNSSSTQCTWQAAGSPCNWPVPQANQSTAIDDLWHAAVNGRGAYFSASDPDSLSAGITGALNGIKKDLGAAAAASSSTLSPVAGDNAAFLATYNTEVWTGNLESRPINIQTGAISKSATWCAQTILPTTCSATGSNKVTLTTGSSTNTYCDNPYTASCSGQDVTVSGIRYCRVEIVAACQGSMRTPREDSTVSNPLVLATSDKRTIKTTALNSKTGKNSLIDFDSAFVKANSSYFDSTQLSKLNQWSSLTTAQRTAATDYNNLAGYFRGQYGYDMDDNNVVSSGGVIVTDNRIFRKREAVLGDILESKPTFNGKSLFKYGYPGYDAFKLAQNANSVVAKGNVYVGANDGMLHAFAADTGIERWAFIPSPVVPNLWKLADSIYSNTSEHRVYVNGSPSISDVCVSNCGNTSSAVWKTILVGGLGAGGRGYYALDITDPANPVLLWEFTATGVGAGAITDDNLGYSYGKPVISRNSDNSWVVLVTSGYNNVNPGDGKGHLYVLDANTGKILKNISTGEGENTTPAPSGLAKIAQWNDEANGNLGGSVYGGDLLGNVWKFDPTSGTVVKFAKLYSDSGKISQPITTTPVLGASGVTRLIMVTTGKYLESNDNKLIASNAYTQTVYAMKDDGSSTYDNPRSLTSDFVQQTLAVDSKNTDNRVITNPKTVKATQKGWFVDLPEAYERVAVDGLLDQGTLIVPSVVPAATDCEAGGHGWLNYFDYLTGAPVADYVSQRTDSPIVGINVYYTAGGERNINVVKADGSQDLMGPRSAGTAGSFTGKRTLWRELTQ